MHVQPFAYCPYYCEENIYRLCETFAADDGYNKELSVVFISNDEGKVWSCSKFHIRSTKMPLNCSCQLPGHVKEPCMMPICESWILALAAGPYSASDCS